MPTEKPHCLNCGTPKGAHIYCKYFSMHDDFDQETMACPNWTSKKTKANFIPKILRLDQTRFGAIFVMANLNQRK